MTALSVFHNPAIHIVAPLGSQVSKYAIKAYKVMHTKYKRKTAPFLGIYNYMTFYLQSMYLYV